METEQSRLPASPLLTVREVAYYLRCSPSTVRKMMDRKDRPLKSRRLSERRRYVHKDDLESFMLSSVE